MGVGNSEAGVKGINDEVKEEQRVKEGDDRISEEPVRVSCTWATNDLDKMFLLAVPGEIVLMGSATNGRTKAVHIHHDADTLRTIKMVDNAIEDHTMSHYSDTLREVLSQNVSQHDDMAPPSLKRQETVPSYQLAHCAEDGEGEYVR